MGRTDGQTVCFRSDLRIPVHLEILCIHESFNETVCTICVQCTGAGYVQVYVHWARVYSREFPRRDGSRVKYV